MTPDPLAPRIGDDEPEDDDDMPRYKPNLELTDLDLELLSESVDVHGPGILTEQEAFSIIALAEEALTLRAELAGAREREARLEGALGRLLDSARAKQMLTDDDRIISYLAVSLDEFDRARAALGDG